MSEKFHSVIEIFSVELWREIFEYFNSNELWYSFRDLNRRIDGIIDRTVLYLNFTKRGTYSYFMKNILSPMKVINIRSLKFTNSNEIQHFFSNFSLDSLIHLRLLSLKCMYSFNDNSFTFWNQLSSLKYLQSLKIIFSGNQVGSDNIIKENEFIIRSIFNKDYCPLLKSLTINIDRTQSVMSLIPSLIPTTKVTNIKYLSLDSLTFNDFIKLLSALQNVKSFYIDSELCLDNESNEPQPNMTIIIPLLPKCTRLHVGLSNDIMLEHVEYLLKHTPNLKDLFVWGWYHLLDAKRWKSLLSMQCPKLKKFELICSGPTDDNDFDQAIEDFERKCKKTPFWRQRNVSVEYVNGSDDDDSEIIFRFNIKKLKQRIK
ncbi:unnamed protein product [Rotaria sordida]|uniref:F-box domain-containing protein n=1 Tax=Rotaria sordida TaxID=392033 RepID=A0A815GVL4_9BILA|nr:unnamed protein product [Rotaria sordida]